MIPVKQLVFSVVAFCCSVSVAGAQEITIRSFPVLQTVSPAAQARIAAPPAPYWNKHPATVQEWKSWVSEFAAMEAQPLPQLREKLGVTATAGSMGGVPVFTLTPKNMPAENATRVLLFFHGGGYVLGPGESGTAEGILMAGLGGFKVIAVDYRMAPDFPYPAALDDAMTVYRELLKTTPAASIGVFGSSTGGGLTLALSLRAKAEGVPLPAALGAGTPWSDLSKTGDSYFTNEGVDTILVSYDGWLGDAARLYANGHDLKDPMLSPVYGDVTGFPPTLLTSGTRDLFLSNTVRMHLKLREANVKADLMVFEGLSHIHYLLLNDGTETQLHFRELSQFFKRNLK